MSMSVAEMLTKHCRHDSDQDNSFSQTNLVSDGSVPAATMDPNLINPWGLASNGRGPFWVADNGSGMATVYDGNGTPQSVGGHSSITIALPPGQTTPTSPTGQAFNFAHRGFDISSGGKTGPSVYLFATEDGTISGWNPNVDAGHSVLAVDNSQGGSGAVYKGLTMGRIGNHTLLYAANFRNGTVDVFNSHFKQVNSFTDPHLPVGYAPFNVQVLGDHLFVTFALQNGAKHDDVAGAGHGFVDEFNLDGTLMHRVASRGPLDSPWGLAMAPSDFGKFSNDLLVGNFGDGTINAFNPVTDQFLGKLDTASGTPVQINDLWALAPGHGGLNGDPNKIYFTSGVQNEAHGLFGALGASADHDRWSSVMAGSHPHG